MQNTAQFIQGQSGGAQGTQTQDPRLMEVRALQSMIPPMLAARYPDVIQMLLVTPSLTFQEKQYWVKLLPLMSLDQVAKLREILMTERKKFFEIQQKYATPGPATVGQIQRKRIEDTQIKKQMIKKQELVDEQQEKLNEDALLKELNTI